MGETLNLRLKRHRRYMKRCGLGRHIFGCKNNPCRDLMGTHHRWWALGQYALKFGEPCRSVADFLANVDFVGIQGALEWAKPGENHNAKPT